MQSVVWLPNTVQKDLRRTIWDIPWAASGRGATSRCLGPAAPPSEGPHDGWGAHRPHLWHSALYHARLLLPSRRYGRHRSRRDLTLWRELGH